MKKRSIAAILLVFVLCMLSACGTKFDSGAYVKACLDAQFKGEFEEYMKYTNSEKEEAEKLYNDGLDLLMASYEELPLSEELKDKLREAYADMLKSAKYEIKETQEEKGDFTVKVAVQPMKCFETYEEDLLELQTEFMNEWQKKVEKGEKLPSEEELMELMAEKVYLDLVERIKGSEFGEEVLIDVEVKKDNNKQYTVNEDDLSKIAEAAFNL